MYSLEPWMLAFIGNSTRFGILPSTLTTNWTTISPSAIAHQVTRTGVRQLFLTDLQARPKVVPFLTTRDIPRLRVKFLLPIGVSGSGSFFLKSLLASHRSFPLFRDGRRCSTTFLRAHRAVLKRQEYGCVTSSLSATKAYCDTGCHHKSIACRFEILPPLTLSLPL